jgi:hypothetical protein
MNIRVTQRHDGTRGRREARTDGRQTGWYRDVARAGYRAAYLRSLARSVASGELDLEALAADRELGDEDVAERLLELPGVGPYAASHHDVDRPLLPTRARLMDAANLRAPERAQGDRRDDREAVPPLRSVRGLAFWLYLTRDWVEDEDAT